VEGFSMTGSGQMLRHSFIEKGVAEALVAVTFAIDGRLR
jgi:hypothetical protein